MLKWRGENCAITSLEFVVVATVVVQPGFLVVIAQVRRFFSQRGQIFEYFSLGKELVCTDVWSSG